MGIVRLTKWVPHCWLATIWDMLSISLTKVGMKLAFGGALTVPQYSPASEILGSERDGERSDKKKKNHIVFLLYEIEVCMEFIVSVIFRCRAAIGKG